MSEVIGRVALLLLLASVAHADVSATDAKRATVLFEEGMKLNDGGRLDQACAKFEESLQLDPQLGTILNVGVCRERVGKLVEAYRLFERAIAEAASTGKQGRETFARERLAAVAAKLVRFTISGIDATIPELEIKIDGRVLAPADYTVQHVAVPGKIVVEATSPAHSPTRIEHAGKAGETAVLALPPLAPRSQIQIVPNPPPPDRPMVTITTHRPKRTLAYVTAATGATLLVGSVLVGFHSKSRYDDAFAAGDADGVSSAQTEANIGTVVGAVGVAAIVVGTVLYFRAGKPRVVATPTGRDGAAVTLVGSF